jgi:DNA ligase (NAD+)
MTKNEIRELLLKAAEAYYNGDEIMSDNEYDALINKLKEIDPNDPLCANGLAASDSNGAEKKIAHTMTTGTLAKCANIDELKDWAAKKDLKERYSLELKIDGSSMELQYVNGEFVKAITRGDGATGLDRTATLSLMNFPKSIDPSFTGSIRAEMVIYNEDFKARFSHKNANPRNAVAGIINRKFETLSTEDKNDPQYVHAICYDVMGKEFSSQTDLMDWLSNTCFFEITPHSTVEAKDLITSADYIREHLRERIANGEIKFNCDGVVIKADIIDREDRQRKTPKRDVALKPELETAVSEIVDIAWEMAGSTLSPVAIINPVQLEGTTVSRVSLSNMAKMKDLGIEIGKMAVVKKSGMIIPQIVKVLN